MIVFRFLARLGSYVWNGTPMTNQGREALEDSRRARGAAGGQAEMQFNVRSGSWGGGLS